MASSEPDYEAAKDDIVKYWNGLSKVQLWSLDTGHIHNLMDMAIENIVALRAELDRAES